MKKTKIIFAVCIFVFCLLINLSLCLYESRFVEPLELTGDEPQYVELAKSFLSSGEFRLDGELTALRPPVYPMFLAACMKIFGQENFILSVRYVQSVINLFILLLIFILAYLLSNSRTVSFMSLVFATFFQPFAYLSTKILSDQLSCVFLLWVFVVGMKMRKSLSPKAIYSWTLLMAMSVVLAILCRPNNSILVLCFPLFFIGLNLPLKKILKAFSLGICVIALFWGAWIVRNYAVFEKIIPVGTYDGYNLYLGNNPDIEGAKGNIIPLPKLPADRIDNEITRDEYYKESAKEFIFNNPAIFVERIPVKLKAFFFTDLDQSKTSKTGWFLLGFLVIAFVVRFLTGSGRMAILILYTIFYWLCWAYIYSGVPFDESVYWHKYPIFFFNYVNFSLGQIIPFVLIGIVILLLKKRLFLNKNLPIFFYILLTVLMTIVYVPKMRVRFSLDPFFIILASYAFNWLITKMMVNKNPEQKKDVKLNTPRF